MLLASAITLFSAIAPAVSALAATPFNGIPSVGVLYKHNDAVKNHFCTAAVIKSKKGNVILTAGHCIQGDGKDLRFAPGYNGSTPYGTYRVTGAYVPDQWNKNFDINYDNAFLTLGNAIVGGKSLPVQNVTGGNSIIYKPRHDNVVHAFAYNMNEAMPIRCQVSTWQFQRAQLGFNCNLFKEGSSGGPMIVDYSPITKVGKVVGSIGGFENGGCNHWTSYSPRLSRNLRSVFRQAETGNSTTGIVVRGDVPDRCSETS